MKISECKKIKNSIKDVLPSGWDVNVYSNGTYYTANLFMLLKNDIRIFPEKAKINIPVRRVFTYKDWQGEVLKIVKQGGL